MENILSLFDGCSGLQQALERANIPYDVILPIKLQVFFKKYLVITRKILNFTS